MSEMLKRILTACVLAPLAVWWMFSPSPWFQFLLAVLGVAALFELVTMLSLAWPLAFVSAGAIGFIALLLSQQVTAIILLLGIVWLAIFMLAARSRTKEQMIEQTLRLGLAYWLEIWLLVFVWALDLLQRQPSGHAFIFGAFAGVWAADIGAYFAGRALGRHKLCAAISPGKTVEGALAGALCGIVVSCGVWVAYAGLSLQAGVLIALVLVLTAILGDLGESAIKRSVGVKDSGKLLPGHGGLLDRIDALLPAVAVAGVLKIVLLQTSV